MHKSATNSAAVSELGRFPLHFDIIRYMLSYWYRLEFHGQFFPLLCNAYCESRLQFEQNIPYWYGSIHFLTNNIDDIKNVLSVSIQKFK